MPSPMEKRNLTSQECWAGSVSRVCRGGGTLHPCHLQQYTQWLQERAVRKHASSVFEAHRLLYHSA